MGRRSIGARGKLKGSCLPSASESKKPRSVRGGASFQPAKRSSKDYFTRLGRNQIVEILRSGNFLFTRVFDFIFSMSQLDQKHGVWMLLDAEALADKGRTPIEHIPPTEHLFVFWRLHPPCTFDRLRILFIDVRRHLRPRPNVTERGAAQPLANESGHAICPAASKIPPITPIRPAPPIAKSNPDIVRRVEWRLAYR